ncbi:hypothetical protein [uncultured Corynebacterium sp.]|nr:hypothetical protein [uncultured Corynebacterium sp.]
MRIKSALSIVLILTSLSVLVSGVLTMINGDVDHSVLGGRCQSLSVYLRS